MPSVSRRDAARRAARRRSPRAHDARGEGRADDVRLAAEGRRRSSMRRATSISRRRARRSRTATASARSAGRATPAAGSNARGTGRAHQRHSEILHRESRLGIPVIFHEECLHGHAAPDGTSFPQPIGLARDVQPRARRVALHDDGRTKRASRGTHQALTPVVDVARDPRWGRVEETFGEDPYLVSRMGIAAVRGFQGDATFTRQDARHRHAQALRRARPAGSRA